LPLSSSMKWSEKHESMCGPSDRSMTRSVSIDFHSILRQFNEGLLRTRGSRQSLTLEPIEEQSKKQVPRKRDRRSNVVRDQLRKHETLCARGGI
jgi:hypothetical protein